MGRWRIKKGVMEGSEESLVWEPLVVEMRCIENQEGLRIFATLAKSTAKFRSAKFLRNFTWVTNAKFPADSFLALPASGF